MIIGQTIQADWIVTNLTTGAEENATGTQTAVLFRNGSVVGAATPTVSNPGTAHYHASVLLDAAHSWAVGDHYSLVASWVEPGTSAKKKLILAQGVITDMATLAKQEEIIGDIAIAQTAIDAIPTNPMLDTEDGSSFGAIPDMATATNQAAIAEYIDTEVAAILDILQADRYIDTSQTPWQLVLIEAGTGGLGVGNELLRQDLKDIDGEDLASINVFVGQQVAP